MDDLDAVKLLVDTLKEFERPDQERIVRWVLEKLGVELGPKVHGVSNTPLSQAAGFQGTHAVGTTDIKTFIAQKNPTSDNQFAAAIAYFYAFEAPEGQRKDSITAIDIQEGCRQAGRPRLGDPGKTLRNAHDMGYLDKADRGSYRINTVGENLVAMALPNSGGDRSTRSARTKKRPANQGKKSRK